MSQQSDRFTVRYWGVRGSIPTPGPETVRYGGNTTCLEVRCGDTLIIIDAGSGLRLLGNELMASSEPIRATMLFSHLHWDHIQGFPFFIPAFTAGNQLNLWSESRVGTTILEVLRGQMAQPTFPVSLDDMGATIQINEFPGGGVLNINDVRVHTRSLNHPGGSTAFRIEYHGRSFVHASDHEHGKPDIDASLVDLAQGADFLSYDATYTESEYHGDHDNSFVGWGHSTWEQAIKFAHDSAARHLVLFHHDPAHTDDQLDAIGVEARARFANTIVAREGLVLEL